MKLFEQMLNNISNNEDIKLETVDFQTDTDETDISKDELNKIDDEIDEAFVNDDFFIEQEIRDLTADKPFTEYNDPIDDYKDPTFNANLDYLDFGDDENLDESLDPDDRLDLFDDITHAIKMAILDQHNAEDVSREDVEAAIDFAMTKLYDENNISENFKKVKPINEESSTPETLEENGVSYHLIKLIKDEWEAIQGYNDFMDILRQMGGKEEIIKVIEDIAGEENLHVGQLQAIMNTVAPNSEKIGEGEAEAQEQLSNSIPQEDDAKVDESLNILELNEQAMVKADAMERCFSLAEKFIEHFDKIYNDIDSKSINHWASEMQTWLNQILDIKLKATNKALSLQQKMDWFFTKGSDSATLFSNNATEAEVYDDFISKVVETGDVKKSLEELDLLESLNEDTIKQNGKWVNKGKEGTHGTFRTKKAADAQRKAMFARGFKENIKESVTDWVYVKSKEVKDSDGFLTDYTMYKNQDGSKYIFMLGDKDYEEPDESYADWEAETEKEANEWFDSYTGFEDEEDDYDLEFYSFDN